MNKVGMMRKLWIGTFLGGIVILLTGCQAAIEEGIVQERGNGTGIRYLALGDSYTIGESVRQSERWPEQLAAVLQQETGSPVEVVTIARTGWTTDELEQAILDDPPGGVFDLVSLLIGVNNQYRGRDVENYAVEFSRLLEMAISFAGEDASRVFVVSIPDYGVTPFAARFDASRIAAEINRYNATAEQICADYGVTFIDITANSRLAATDLELLAPDLLHPSGKMYAAWVTLISPAVSEKVTP